jgi:hypothetical protein
MRSRINLLLFVLLILSCKKPFTPALSNADNGRYLVIEGTISANDSTFIRLARTKKVDTLKTIISETGAIVTIESDASSSYALTEIRSGIYATPPLNLDASHKYRLRVKTSDNKEYLSDYVPLKNSPPIDSVGFVAQGSGVQIYVNTHDPAKATRYYRWDFNEDWQFHSMYRSAYYSNGIDSIKSRIPSMQVYDCFGSDSSQNIVIASTVKLAQDLIYQAPITLLPANSEKIETKYSILVKQYALTDDAYAFWENLQKNTEKIGSIFDALPSEVQSNFHCVSNPNELVIGYLSAGNVATKRIFISASQLLPGYSPQYPCYCEIDTAFFSPTGVQKSVAVLVPSTSPYIPIKALYPVPAGPMGLPYAYTFSTILCTDCTVRGTRSPPSFWK